MLKILPSIASADQLALREEIARVEKCGRLHLDIEDGHFIDNITFGKKTVAAISREFHGVLDAHLMTTHPEAYLPWLHDIGMKAICGHIEALMYPKQFLRQARAFGMRAGLALNMKVHPETLCAYLEDLDYALVMTSEPDAGEQTFFPCACKRVAQIRSLLRPETELWCDGGIQSEHLRKLHNAGMDTAVMGRAVFSADDPAAAIKLYERSVI